MRIDLLQVRDVAEKFSLRINHRQEIWIVLVHRILQIRVLTKQLCDHVEDVLEEYDVSRYAPGVQLAPPW